MSRGAKRTLSVKQKKAILAYLLNCSASRMIDEVSELLTPQTAADLGSYVVAISEFVADVRKAAYEHAKLKQPPSLAASFLEPTHAYEQ